MEPIELPRMGTSLERIEAGNPEAIAIMEANLEKELMEWRRKLQLEREKGNQKQT